MTPAELQAIRKRAEKATRGPWKPIGDIYIYAPIGMVADTPINEGAEWITRARGVGRGATLDEQTRNLEFIAHARQDIPALLAEVERLRAVNEGLAAEVVDLRIAMSACGFDIDPDRPLSSMAQWIMEAHEEHRRKEQELREVAVERARFMLERNKARTETCERCAEAVGGIGVKDAIQVDFQKKAIEIIRNLKDEA